MWMNARLDSWNHSSIPNASRPGWTPKASSRARRSTVERITTGHSNEVFRVTRGERVFVLRRPPRTPLSPTAHDMAREFRLLRAFFGHASVPVPEPIACCVDHDVLGVPFYLMAPIDGVVVRETLPAPLADDAGAPRACAYALIDALAGIHAFDWQAGGLADFGKPDGYLERQVPRWLGPARAVRDPAVARRRRRRAAGCRRTRRRCSRPR